MNSYNNHGGRPVDELYNTRRDKTIVVLGFTCSGKTTLCSRMFDSCYHIMHTDDYIAKYGFEDSLYEIMEDEKRLTRERLVIEGVQGYRLLRKWAQQRSGSADLVITCVAPLDVRAQRYAERNNGKELTSGFDKALSKIWMDWRTIDGGRTRCVMYDTVENKMVIQ